MNQSPKQSANIEFKLCPPSLSKSSFARSNSSVGTQKRVFRPCFCHRSRAEFGVRQNVIESSTYKTDGLQQKLGLQEGTNVEITSGATNVERHSLVTAWTTSIRTALRLCVWYLIKRRRTLWRWRHRRINVTQQWRHIHVEDYISFTTLRILCTV